MRTVVIGLGNPVRSDDAVGLHAARQLACLLAPSGAVDVRELHTGGLRLMESMAGYQRAVLLDAICTAGGAPGAIYRMAAARLTETRNCYSMHDGSLAVAMELGRQAGLELPGEILAWAVEAGDIESFSMELTAPVRAAVPALVREVMRELAAKEGGPA